MSINNKDVLGRSQDINKMQGHWLLAKLGKRILRPGGRELTNEMLDNLEIQSTDKVIEFAPGLGYTTQLTLRKKPSSYIAIERDEAAANSVRKLLKAENHHCHIGYAEETGLPNESATVIYGEAMLTMQTPNKKQLIVNEASRLLYPGGRYGIHELCLVPDDIDEEKKENGSCQE